MSAHVPLAWLQLVKLKGRFIAAIAGIGFAVVLAMVQLGFQDALYTSITRLYSHMEADLVLISPQYQSIVAREAFPERRLYQALGDDRVANVSAVYMDTAQWTNPANHRERFIFMVGFRPGAAVFDLPEVHAAPEKMAEPASVLFDDGSRPEFGPIAELFRQTGPVETEVSGRRVRVNGLFRIGASFANSGQIITSDTNFLRIAPNRKLGDIDVGLVRLKPGADLEQTRDRLTSLLPNDVAVLTKQAFLDREKSYWSSGLPIGFLFGASVVMSVVVGAVIVYQILYSGVSEHLAEFATLKAIGYSDGRLFRVVVEEALILSVLGFVPGWLIATAGYQAVTLATSLPLRMTAGLAVLVYVLTAGMCLVAGSLAMRKLRSADPAEVF